MGVLWKGYCNISFILVAVVQSKEMLCVDEYSSCYLVGLSVSRIKSYEVSIHTLPQF